MARKERKTITEEIFNVVKNMSEGNNFNISQISSSVGLHVRTVSKLIKEIESGVMFKSAAAKLKETVEAKNNSFSAEEQSVFTSLAVNNTLTLKEIKIKLESEGLKSYSVSPISKKIKKIGLTRKRISLIPAERNSENNINLRDIYSQEISRINLTTLYFWTKQA